MALPGQGYSVLHGQLFIGTVSYTIYDETRIHYTSMIEKIGLDLNLTKGIGCLYIAVFSLHLMKT